MDDNPDLISDQEILINFLLGVKEEIYETLILIETLDSLEGFFLEALKLEAMIDIKQEIIEEDQITNVFEGVKSEKVQIEPDFEDDFPAADFPAISDFEDDYQEDKPIGKIEDLEL